MYIYCFFFSFDLLQQSVKWHQPFQLTKSNIIIQILSIVNLNITIITTTIIIVVTKNVLNFVVVVVVFLLPLLLLLLLHLLFFFFFFSVFFFSSSSSSSHYYYYCYIVAFAIIISTTIIVITVVVLKLFVLFLTEWFLSFIYHHHFQISWRGQAKEDLELAHRKELEKIKEELEQEKSLLLAAEAARSDLQSSHKNDIERINTKFKEEVEALRNLMDSSHGDQVKELQRLLQGRYDEVDFLLALFVSTVIPVYQGSISPWTQLSRSALTQCFLFQTIGRQISAAT